MTRLLVIAGTDSSGGAGLTRDAAVAAELGGQVRPVVTAVTAQTDDAVSEIHPVPPPVVTAQIEAVFAKDPPEAVKIGMLATGETAEAVAWALARHAVPVVLDPVLKASSGGTLSPDEGIARLLPLATLLTPNLIEAAALSGLSAAPVAAQAARLRATGAQAVLIKGGHGRGTDCTDHLFCKTGVHRFRTARLPHGKRGSGCALSTAIACRLADGASLPDACNRAKEFLQDWLTRGRIGFGDTREADPHDIHV